MHEEGGKVGDRAFSVAAPNPLEFSSYRYPQFPISGHLQKIP